VCHLAVKMMCADILWFWMMMRAIRLPSRSASVSLFFRRSYHPNVIDHYENPRNVGSLDKNKKT
jgi:hypothetical protein